MLICRKPSPCCAEQTNKHAKQEGTTPWKATTSVSLAYAAVQCRGVICNGGLSKQGLINHEDVVRFSDSTLDASDALADQLHLNLSTCYREDTWAIEDALNALVNAHNASVDISLWQYLVLRHVYINRDSYQDPLDEVASIYADFGFDEEVEKFVYYMPLSGCNPSRHTYEENTARLYANWELYLRTNREKYFHH